VLGTTLEQPPNQPNGGGFNSSLSSDTVTLATPLASGDSINVHFLLGIQQTGSFKFYVNVEILTDQSTGGELVRNAPPRKAVKGRVVTAGSPAPSAPGPTVQVSETPLVAPTRLPFIFRYQMPTFSAEVSHQTKKTKRRVKTKRSAK
jgi:hypothetical protein